MDSSPPGLNRECIRCHAVLAPGALVCGSCHALVHSVVLEQLAAAARLHEARREFTAAREVWLKALGLLPPESSQAEWVRGNVQRLAPARNAWISRLGPLAPLVLLLIKGKFLLTLFKLKFILSLGAFVAVYWGLYGLRFGVGFAILILVHELGHYIEIRRRGLPAEMPVFLPGLGAYVRWTTLGVSAPTRSLISLAGPMAGLIGAAVCVVLWMRSGDSFWMGLASLSAMLNVLNLIPVWILDGGQAIAALDKNERFMLAAVAVILAAYFAQPLFVLVAAGAVYRAFTKDLPAVSSHATTAYYLAILAGLGFVIGLAPVPVPGM
ncbi:MAG TPA: site-2 protease family protein [Steroidobacteraceae bacterium]|jgi:Zn-dependent protease|nr:site-2 protease family protein [Steroidobacteraceae bacterium]